MLPDSGNMNKIRKISSASLIGFMYKFTIPRNTETEVISVAKRNRKKPHSMTEKQPLPIDSIQSGANHGKTASNLADPGDLPVNILENEVPVNDLHDM